MNGPPYQDEREKTAALCRMLGVQRTIGMFGHVSVRVAGTDHVLLSPGAGSEKTTVVARDCFVFDLDGTIVEHPGHEVPLEWRIHTQVHRDRPDALCVVHLHAHYATLLGIGDAELAPVFLHGAFLGAGFPTWDEPRLVVNDELAVDLSRCIGTGVGAQMRGHGTVIVAESPERAFFYATFLEENARFQVEGAALGGARPLAPDVAAACAAGTRNERLLRLLWEYHARRASAPSLEDRP